MFLISCGKENSTELVSEENSAVNNNNYENGSATSRTPAPKIDVCHYDDETNSWEVININENAWPAHVAHGDVQLIDNDGDGWVVAENECVPGGDCDDSDPAINPDADEIPYNGKDDDCDSNTPDDDLDGDGFLNANDCDDNNATVNPGATEICNNAIDDDCDSDVDGADSDCSTSCVPEELGEELEVTVNGPSGPYTLYVYPEDNSAGIQWSYDFWESIEAYDYWDGDANTDAIVANQGPGTDYAAGLCNSLKTDGCDWYLPSFGELIAIYQQLGPNGSGDMFGNYWSSYNAGDGIRVMPEDGTGWILSLESNLFPCRCVRR